jgi:hypothetical protein
MHPARPRLFERPREGCCLPAGPPEHPEKPLLSVGANVSKAEPDMNQAARATGAPETC